MNGNLDSHLNCLQKTGTYRTEYYSRHSESKTSRYFTIHQTLKSCGRLNYFLISANLTNKTTECKISSGSGSLVNLKKKTLNKMKEVQAYINLITQSCLTKCINR